MHDISNVKVKNPIVLTSYSKHSSHIEFKLMSLRHTLNLIFRMKRYFKFLLLPKPFFKIILPFFILHCLNAVKISDYRVEFLYNFARFSQPRIKQLNFLLNIKSLRRVHPILPQTRHGALPFAQGHLLRNMLISDHGALFGVLFLRVVLDPQLFFILRTLLLRALLLLFEGERVDPLEGGPLVLFQLD